MPWLHVCKCSKCGVQSNGGGTKGWLSVYPDSDGNRLIVEAVNPKFEDRTDCCSVGCTISVVSDFIRNMSERA